MREELLVNNTRVIYIHNILLFRKAIDNVLFVTY
jgi:hypothetical protein